MSVRRACGLRARGLSMRIKRVLDMRIKCALGVRIKRALEYTAGQAFIAAHFDCGLAYLLQ